MELLEDRIDRAERLVRSLKKQTAPTIPQYDLQGGAPPPVAEWHLNFLVNSFNSPTDGIQFSLYRDTFNDPNEPPLGDTVFNSGEIDFPFDGAIHNVQWNIPPDGFPPSGYVIGDKYWIVIGRMMALPYDSSSYQYHLINPSGGIPPTQYSYYDGTVWHQTSGTLFTWGGFNLPVGANGWIGTDNGITGEFASNSLQYIAQRFTL